MAVIFMKKLKIALKIILFIYVVFFISSVYAFEEDSVLFWPPPPAEIRVSFVKSLYSSASIGIKTGLFKKLKSLILGEEKNVLNKPIAVTVDSKGNLFVCDVGTPALHIFRQKEKKYQKITEINKIKLVSPVGVAVSGGGLIFIADSQLKEVFCIEENGRFKFILSEKSGLLRPTGLAVRKDNLYVVDTLANSVKVFDLKGNFISEFGKRGKGEGEFNYPTAIWIDSEGKVYVVDTLNFRIQVFDENNKFLSSLGKLGDSSGSFSRPKGVAVDSFGHIYTTDGMFDNIQIFDKDMRLLLFLGQTGQKDGEFWIPCGISVDSQNYIYVADSYNQRIQIFHYVGKD